MKAIAKCPICKETVESDCVGCITSGKSTHFCKGKVSSVKVKWKIYAENDKDEDYLESRGIKYVKDDNWSFNKLIR